MTLQIPEINVDHDLVRHSLSDSLQEALNLIESIESLPSCAKIASSTLMYSCSALEGSIEHDESNYTRGSDLFIEEEADVYSARLAVCELNGADFLIPKECQTFIPTDRVMKKRGIRGFWSRNGPTEPTGLFQYYDDITKANLQQCRKALGSTSQSWTSYSNSRQNAVVMCHAMRSQVEKDEQLHVGRILASTAAATTGSLQDALEQVNQVTSRFRELSSLMPQFQHDLAAGNEQQLGFLQKFWTDVEKISGGLQDIANGVTAVQDGVGKANDGVIDLRTTIHATTDLASQVTDLIAGELQAMGELSGNLAASSDMMQYRVERTTQSIIKSLADAGQNLEAINDVVPGIHQKLMAIAENGVRMQMEQKKHQREYQVINNETMVILKQVKEDAQAVNATFGSFSRFLGAVWPEDFEPLKNAAGLIVYVIVFGLLSFGVWETKIGLSFMSSCSASMGIGLGESH